MNIESQVCSLELAKRLKELGVKQDSIFVWEYYDDTCFAVKFIPYAVAPGGFNHGIILYSAFTVAELGNLLPNQINNKFLTSHRCSRDGWWVFYANKNDKDEDINATWDLNEANARAKMLIYLIENKFVKI